VDYGKEELVAKLGAAFLCARCDIEQPILPNAAVYLRIFPSPCDTMNHVTMDR